MENDRIQLFEETIRVNAFECDINRRLKPAVFFQRMTETAVIHAARLGVGFEDMLARNLFWVHSRMKIKFFEFPGPGDMITIRTWPKTIQQKLFFIRDFEVLDAGGRKLAAATSAWLIIDAAARKMVAPQSLDLDLPALANRTGLDEPLERLGMAESGEERLRVRAGYSAVDIVGHANNSRYVEWICDAFPYETFRHRKIDWLQINYDHEIRPDEEVSVLVNGVDHDPDLWALEGRIPSSDTRSFEALVRWQD
jgi:medium-chain acyl-[acyl-carrier-protein] hydrolase